MWQEKIALTLLLAGLVLVSCGCAAAVIAAGAGAVGTVAYVRGDLETLENENVETLYNAALQALEELKIPVFSRNQDALAARIEGRTADDKKIIIKIEAHENNLSKISIRIGTFGDQTQSRLVYEKIKKYLTPPAV